MSRRSRAFILPALVFPAVIAGLSIALMLVLLPLGPEAINLHWSSAGDPRWASPSELLFVPIITMAVSVLIWGFGPVAHPLCLQWPVAVGNALSAFLNSTAVAFLIGAFVAGGEGRVRTVAFIVALLSAALTGILTIRWNLRNAES